MSITCCENGSEDIYLFNPKILKNVQEECLSTTGLVIRPLAINDFHRGYEKLLHQLSVSQCCMTQSHFSDIFNFMKNCGSESKCYVVVLEDIETTQIIGSATLEVVQKFSHDFAKKCSIEDVVVSDNYRGRRLGKLLVNTLCDLSIHEVNAHKVTLNCTQKLSAFYFSLGFIPKPDGEIFMQLRHPKEVQKLLNNNEVADSIEDKKTFVCSISADTMPFVETSLFDEEILSNLCINSSSFISSSEIARHFHFRPLSTLDFDRGYLELVDRIGSLDISRQRFLETFGKMKNCEKMYYVTVVEDLRTSKIVMSATLEVRRKFIRGGIKKGTIDDIFYENFDAEVEIEQLLIHHLILMSKHLNCYKVTLNCDVNKAEGIYRSLGFQREVGNDVYMQYNS